MWNDLVRNSLILTHSMGINEHPDRAPIKRSSKWSSVRKQHLSNNPVCAVCDATKNLEVHHKLPFHLAPELELEPRNLITLCSGPGIECHITFGHLGNWKFFNLEIDSDVQRWRLKIHAAETGNDFPAIQLAAIQQMKHRLGIT